MSIAKVRIELPSGLIDFKDATNTQKNNYTRYLYDKNDKLIKKMTPEDIKRVNSELDKKYGTGR